MDINIINNAIRACFSRCFLSSFVKIDNSKTIHQKEVEIKDLLAYKNSISDLDIYPEKYIIQAKRYKNTVPVKEIREFKGTASYEKIINIFLCFEYNSNSV